MISYDFFLRTKQYTIIETKKNLEYGQFAENVKESLTSVPKSISGRYLWDYKGSLLYEKICQTPEYYLARTENKILIERASEITEGFPKDTVLIELGSGNSEKTCNLIETFLNRQTHLHYIPVDISSFILDKSANFLIKKYPGLTISGIATTNEKALQILKKEMNSSPKLILWTGSSIGQLNRKEAAEFLQYIQTTIMNDQDKLLIGIDLKKSKKIIEGGYPKSQELLLRFIKNILHRINQELSGNFDLDSFDLKSEYNEIEGRMEIYLVSNRKQQVKIDSLELEIEFRKEESIHIINSYKYSIDDIQSLAIHSGLTLQDHFTDKDSLFSINLFSTNNNHT